MVTRPLILALALLILPGNFALAQEGRGTTTEERDYAAREAEAPGLEEFSGGFYMLLAFGVLAAVGYFVCLCVSAIWDWVIPDPDPLSDLGPVGP